MPIPNTPPLPAVGTIGVELFGGDTDADRWDEAKFDDPEATWALAAWRDVTPESLTVEVKWGADDPQGILTVPAASIWQIVTYDPERKLDPTNGVSGYAAALKPGHAFRILFKPANDIPWTVRHGFIDTIDYDLASKTGSIRGSDAVQLMVGAVLPEGQDLDAKMPTTLRERARYLIQKAKLQNIVKVEGDRDWPAIVREFRPARWYRHNEKFNSDPLIDRAGNQFASNGYYSGEGGVKGIKTQQVSVVSGKDKAVWSDGWGSINLPVWQYPAWTLVFWIKWDDTAIREPRGSTKPGDPLLNAYGGELISFGDIIVWMEANGSLFVGKNDTQQSVYYYHSVTPVPVDTLSHMIGLSESAEGIRIWIDGMDVTVQDAAWIVEPKGTWCTLAMASPELSNWIGWCGYVDESVVFDRLLDADDMGRLYTYGQGLDGDYDPPVGPAIAKEANLWAHITTAAYDALYAVWLDRLNVVRFRSFGQPRSIGVQVGGLLGMGIDTVVVGSSMQGVFTRVVAYDMDGYNPDAPVPIEAIDDEKQKIYGDIVLHRQHPVPDAETWADVVLGDRAGASLQLVPGTIRPQSDQDMVDLLQLGMVDEIDLVVESAIPDVNVNPLVLGGTFHAETVSGWSAQVVSYIPNQEWDDLRGPEPPPWDPSQPSQYVWREYLGTQSARLVHTPTADAGNGKGASCTVGAFGQQYRNRSRMLVKFPVIDFSDVIAIDTAQLQLWTTQQCLLVGKTPKVIVRRILKGWGEGTFGTACAWSTTNGVIYPGPNGTQQGQVTKAVSRVQNTLTTIAIPAIVRAWKNGAAQQGVKIVSVGEDNPAYSTEFHSVHTGNPSYIPKLRVRVRVPV